MNFRNRHLPRLGAAALLATGALAAAGAPAYAAGTQTDLELSVVGTKLAAGAQGKIAWAKITNKGQNTPSKVSVSADLSGLDLDKIIAVPVSATECDGSEATKTITCTLSAQEIPGPGQTQEVPVVIIKGDATSGPYSGPVKFTVTSPDDTTPGNNSKTVDVAIGEQSGVDLGVLVPDVKYRINPATDNIFPIEGETPPALHAGETTVVAGWVFNWGDAIANGVKLTVRLPENVTFTETEPDCTYSADQRTATCAYDSIVLNPLSEGGNDAPVAAFWWPIKVADGVTAPVTLPDGSWTAEALGQLPIGSPAALKANKSLPKNVKLVSAKSAGVTEVDQSDNVDGFAVVVAAQGGAGGGGSLPVTGVQAGLIGGVGLAVVIAGGVLFLVARRRRVVLVTPGDEKPAA
jgi:hypothetical protein